MNNSNLPLPNDIDGVAGSHNIVNMWKSQYEHLFNCLSNSKDVNNICKNADYQRDVEVSHSEIIHAIKYLKDNNSCYNLSMCFTSLFVHGVLPESMISVVFLPIVKNKNASIYSKSNYRPIALASIVSKVLEKIIYDRIAYSLMGFHKSTLVARGAYTLRP